jgi:TRAP-type C4-dicarboxylate transport system substrate-binding protein
MPFLFRDMDHMDRVVSGPAFEELKAAAARKGLRLLGIYSSGIRHIMTKEPIQSMADLKGKKIRTMQNPVHIEAFKAFGANATPLAYGELYGALQTGVVDGAEAANTNYNGARFYEVAKNWALVGWLNLTAPLVISEKKFVALPADVQRALVEAGAESAKWERKLVIDTDKPLLERIKAQGAKVTTPDPEPFRQASRQVYEKMLTTPTDKKLLNLIMETK